MSRHLVLAVMVISQLVLFLGASPAFPVANVYNFLLFWSVRSHACSAIFFQQKLLHKICQCKQFLLDFDTGAIRFVSTASSLVKTGRADLAFVGGEKQGWVGLAFCWRSEAGLGGPSLVLAE